MKISELDVTKTVATNLVSYGKLVYSAVVVGIGSEMMKEFRGSGALCFVNVSHFSDDNLRAASSSTLENDVARVEVLSGADLFATAMVVVTRVVGSSLIAVYEDQLVEVALYLYKVMDHE